ncbi:MAG: hypothetical protein KGM98_13185, partial [Bacteroidota bacterium]|nr:hypothetical protein [Bacteroidota bacterium]
VEKKGFKEYFLEFLMIFLAVTLGFFAETLRERISEHRLVREYARSLVKDLREDSSQLNVYIKYYGNAANNVDTLLQVLATKDPKEVPTGKLYWYGLFGGSNAYFTPNDATLQQIKSTGTLRYFSTQTAIAIANYDRLCRNMETRQQDESRLYIEVRKSRAQIFEFKYNEMANDIYQEEKKTLDRSKIDSFIQSKPPLLTYDKALFNEYSELMRSRFLHLKVQAADTLLTNAGNLIRLLQSE